MCLVSKGIITPCDSHILLCKKNRHHYLITGEGVLGGKGRKNAEHRHVSQADGNQIDNMNITVSI